MIGEQHGGADRRSPSLHRLGLTHERGSVTFLLGKVTHRCKHETATRSRANLVPKEKNDEKD
jgi:hypothetical protein